MKKTVWIILIGFGFTMCNQTVTDVEKMKEIQPNSFETTELQEETDDEFLNAEKYRFEYKDDNSELIQVNLLAIKRYEKNKFSFKITTATKQGCTGEIIGKATITNGVGKYIGKYNQELWFKFSKSKITVEESDYGNWSGEYDGSGYRGAGCSFDGEYIKISRL